MIPQNFIQELVDKTDIIELIGGYLALKKSGANHWAKCPFHTEKTPSFSVNAVKNVYHCFGCGAHGNAIGFLMEHQDFLTNYRSQNWLKAREHIDKYRFSKTEFTLYY